MRTRPARSTPSSSATRWAVRPAHPGAAARGRLLGAGGRTPDPRGARRERLRAPPGPPSSSLATGRSPSIPRPATVAPREPIVKHRARWLLRRRTGALIEWATPRPASAPPAVAGGPPSALALPCRRAAPQPAAASRLHLIRGSPSRCCFKSARPAGVPKARRRLCLPPAAYRAMKPMWCGAWLGRSAAP
jgi:hypothetical protein